MFDPEALKLLTLPELLAIIDQLNLREQTDWDEVDQVKAEMKSRIKKFTDGMERLIGDL